MVTGGQTTTKDRAKVTLKKQMGKVFLAAFEDPLTIEILLNENGKLWVEKLGKDMEIIGEFPPSTAKIFIDLCAGYLDKQITADSPLLEGEFPLDGSRFTAQIPPIVHHPTFSIRKKPHKIFTLENYVADGIMTSAQKEVILKAIDQHKNILIIGSTGSGKTTLVNGVIDAMVQRTPQDRVIIIEDTGEIQCAAKNYVQFHTTREVTMTDLLRTTLRMRPDRILVGEVRGPEALDLLDAWNTGHPGGIATLHADSALQGLYRLHSLVTRNPFAPSDIDPLIGEAVHIVIFIAKTKDHGRKIQEILEISGFQEGHFLSKPI